VIALAQQPHRVHQDTAALHAGHARPGQEALARAFDRVVDVGLARDLDPGDDLAGGRIDVVEGLVGGGVDQPAVDIELQLVHGVSPILIFSRCVMKSKAARRASAPSGPRGFMAARSHMPSIRQARSWATCCTSGSRRNGRRPCTRLLCRRRMMTIWMRARLGWVGTWDQKASQALTASALNSSGPRLPSTTAISRCAGVFAACRRGTTERLRLTASWRIVASS